MSNIIHQFAFNGKGGSFLMILIKNIFLAMVTLGIYLFWGKVKIRKFFYQNLRFMDEPFDYHGTGKEIFIGFLKFLGFLVGFIIIDILIGKATSAIFGPMTSEIITALLVYIVLIAILPLILAGGLRYRLSRSSWKNIRFRFFGNYKELALIYYKGLPLAIVTLGIYGPWLYHSMRSYIISHSSFGNQKFEYDGSANEFAKKVLIGIILTIITFGIYSIWLKVNITNYFWNHTLIQGKRFNSAMTGGEMFGTLFGGYILIFITFFIATPWVLIWIFEVFINGLTIEEGLDLASVSSDYDPSASGMADSLEGLGGIFDAVGTMLG
jgi:uncharacterized membrane protein YjgN (DUF898 family)